MKKIFTKLNVIILLFSTLSLLSATENKFEQNEYDISADMAGINNVTVTSNNGPIAAKVHAERTAFIHVTAKATYKNGVDPQKLLDAVKLKYTRKGDALNFFFDFGEFADDQNAKSAFSGSLEVSLPKDISIDLVSSNGSIKAEAFSGNVHIKTSNGTIASSGCGQKAFLTSSNGSITLDNAAGDVIATTSNGSISIQNAAKSVDATSSNGAIIINIDGDLKGDISAKTSNGEIELITNDCKNYSLEAETCNGEIKGRKDLEYNKSYTIAKSTIGEGRYKINLKSSNASIIIK